MKNLLCALALVLAACAGDAPPSSGGPDAAPGGGADARMNQPFGAVCSTASDTSTECASGVCTDSFDMLATPECSQTCTVLGGDDPTCPVGSMGQKCNKKGYCRP